MTLNFVESKFCRELRLIVYGVWLKLFIRHFLLSMGEFHCFYILISALLLFFFGTFYFVCLFCLPQQKRINVLRVMFCCSISCYVLALIPTNTHLYSSHLSIYTAKHEHKINLYCNCHTQAHTHARASEPSVKLPYTA